MAKLNKNYTWKAMCRQGRVRQFIDSKEQIVFAASKPIKSQLTTTHKGDK